MIKYSKLVTNQIYWFGRFKGNMIKKNCISLKRIKWEFECVRVDEGQ